MIPIQDLLSRIRWDKRLEGSRFEIGYFDHLAGKVIRIPLGEVHFESGNSFSFDWLTPEGEIVSIPFHRIREVYRDGVCIWNRNVQATPNRTPDLGRFTEGR